MVDKLESYKEPEYYRCVAISGAMNEDLRKAARELGMIEMEFVRDAIHLYLDVGGWCDVPFMIGDRQCKSY
jgi:hypothetical protein